MTTESVLLIDDADGTRTLTLNRPESFNSLTYRLKEELLAALHAAAADDSVRAVVLTGAGRAFCAGQDLREHIEELRAGSENPMTTVAKHYNPIARALTELPKPVIAAVNGMAAGAGAAFAYACDLRIAAESSRFLMAFANVGLSADSGSSWTLPRLIGYGRAMEMMLLARPVDAQRALAIGMVNEVVPDGTALDRARQLAAQLAAGPTTAYGLIKRSLLAGAGADLAAALAVEDRSQTTAGHSSDHLEGVEAFTAKRPPKFTGK
ncbi:MAG TPA: enoyl-CoA hydratase-related protein [Pseudonocardiaceae bacterium]